MRRAIPVLFLAAAALGCMHPVGIKLRYQINGHVSEWTKVPVASLVPVAGISVTLRGDGVSADKVYATAVSDSNGNFSMEFEASRCDRWFAVTSRSDPVFVDCDYGLSRSVVTITLKQLP